MKLVRWNPFREMETLQDTINRMFDDKMEGIKGNRMATGFRPLVDIYEEKDSIHLDVELPGMESKDVKINVENDMLTIQGERKDETSHKDKDYHRVERYYGTFCRSFALPTNVDRENIKASFKNGILKVKLPKKEEAKPKQISIKAEG